MPEAHIEAEIVLDLPDGADQSGDSPRLPDFLLVEEFGDRPYLPLHGALDDAANKVIEVLVTRKLGHNVGVHRSPVPALRHDCAKAGTETAIRIDARQQRPEFDCDARAS